MTANNWNVLLGILILAQTGVIGLLVYHIRYRVEVNDLLLRRATNILKYLKKYNRETLSILKDIQTDMVIASQEVENNIPMDGVYFNKPMPNGVSTEYYHETIKTAEPRFEPQKYTMVYDKRDQGVKLMENVLLEGKKDVETDAHDKKDVADVINIHFQSRCKVLNYNASAIDHLPNKMDLINTYDEVWSKYIDKLMGPRIVDINGIEIITNVNSTHGEITRQVARGSLETGTCGNCHKSDVPFIRYEVTERINLKENTYAGSVCAECGKQILNYR